MTKHNVYFGDCRTMKGVDDQSVQLVVTSPPYWSIKDYGNNDQIGYGETVDEYQNSLGLVINECHRALSPGCRMAVNIGDQYLRASEHGKYSVLPIPIYIIQRSMDAGFDYMGSIIWTKITSTNTTGGCSWMGATYYPGDGHVTYEHEYICLFRKSGKRVTPKDPDIREGSKLTKEERSHWFRGLWNDVRPVRQTEHVAMFPTDIPNRLIRMYTYIGETVLDPFMGSGTTALAAYESNRNSIGYELNPQMLPVMKEKVGKFIVPTSEDEEQV